MTGDDEKLMEALPPVEQEAADGIRRMESLLVFHAELHQARTRTHAFTEQMPWLTTGQREEIAQLYTEQHLALSKKVMRALVAHITELRSHYTTRYETLKRRVCCTTIVVLTALAAFCVHNILVSGPD